MKPYHFLLTTLASATALGGVASVTIPGLADSRPSLDLAEASPEASPSEPLVASLPTFSDRLWVRVRAETDIEQLASQLALDETRLAKLNDVNEDHQFRQGDWLVLPSQSSKRAKQLAAIDTSELRRSPPVSGPPAVEDAARVKFGDSLVKIAQRYNLTISELLKLNPGLEAARLVVGTQIRLAQSAPGPSRMVLGLKPTGSGGLSWPDTPSFGDGQDSPSFRQPTSTTGWIWPTTGVFSSGYGWRWGRMHKGIDVANNVGTPIYAAKGGQVATAGWNDGGYGNMVEIRHDDGSHRRYAHNSRILVHPRQLAAPGTLHPHTVHT